MQLYFRSAGPGNEKALRPDLRSASIAVGDTFGIWVDPAVVEIGKMGCPVGWGSTTETKEAV